MWGGDYDTARGRWAPEGGEGRCLGGISGRQSPYQMYAGVPIGYKAEQAAEPAETETAPCFHPVS
jgi:hypothetical protein